MLGQLAFANNIHVESDEPYKLWLNYCVSYCQSVNIDLTKDNLMKIVPFSMYERLLQILHINCMTISYETDDIATGLFGLSSLFNHSCEPNVELANKMEYQSGYAY